ncbi:hypothetical protein KG088_09990 [Halomonas sp. TRM85114]|uniref:hypothetical protein n=1 Tax=Halomonas jincaotanensis TaxID=2810616 RepID=UPI001BD5A815|nr:hypothetical protein [Halomonas jincaotanensis]MBS9403960.1 hypothetical protein [Halomonas jincaotanensis]
MSNGLYQQLECRCGAICLLACGTPLGMASTAAGEAVTLWSREVVQICQGLDDLDSREEASGGDVQACRHCGEALLVQHDEVGVVVVPWASVDNDSAAAMMATSTRERLEALGYRF